MESIIFFLLVIVSFGQSLQPPEPFVRKGGLRASRPEPQVAHGRRQLIPPSGDPATYTMDAHFDEGSMINVNHDDPAHHQLQLDVQSTPFNYIFVAASSLGTVVKVNTDTGEVLGEYRTTPENQSSGNPSRTTIDKDGSVWVANRNNVYDEYGSVVHIGLVENGQCEDRNNDGIIDTSTGLDDIKDWTDLTLTDASVPGTTGRPVMTAEDECIIHYTKVNSKGTRHVSIDGNNDVWVGGSSVKNFDLVKGGRYDVANSGTIIRSETSVDYGGYGGIMNQDGVIWSARPLLRWDPTNSLSGGNGDPGGPSIGPPASGKNWAGQSVFDSYGLCSDSEGNVWNTQVNKDQINKYQPTGAYIGGYSLGNGNSNGNFAQGCAVDKHNGDDVWVAHALDTGHKTVGHLTKDGFHVGNVDLSDVSDVIDTPQRTDPRSQGEGPTGVAVDKNGKIWSANYRSHSLSRIDPSFNSGVGGVDLTVGLRPGSYPYNYGDMTGNENIAPPDHGTWEVTHDSGVVDAEWRSIQWNDETVSGSDHTPGDSFLTVEIAAFESPGVPLTWETVTNGEILTGVIGQYLKVKVSFDRATTGDPPKSPILTDLTITINQPPNCDDAEANPKKLWPPNHKFRNIEIEGVTDPDGDDIEITIQGICQDEPVEGKGDGNTVPDGKGVGTSVAKVRSERKGTKNRELARGGNRGGNKGGRNKGGGNGRVYTIYFMADDGTDTCEGEVEVCVPHDQSGAGCVDDGPQYDSTELSESCPHT